MAKSKKSAAPTKQAKNKTAAIVAVATANPDMPAKDAAAKIQAEYGMEVKPAYYSLIKSRSRNESVKGTKKRGRKPKAVRSNSEFSDLLATKKFADQVGGIEQARSLLETLEKVR